MTTSPIKWEWQTVFLGIAIIAICVPKLIPREPPLMDIESLMINSDIQPSAVEKIKKITRVSLTSVRAGDCLPKGILIAP